MRIQLKIYAIMTVTFVTMITISCKDTLNVRQPVNQLNSVQVFESVGTADAALSNLYSEMQAYSLFSGSSGGAGALLGAYTDELVSFDVFSSNADYDIYNNVQQVSNTSIKSVWATAYSHIYLTNSIIEGVEKSTTISQDQKNRIKGEALFMRSLILFYLQQIFGEIPYPATTDYTINRSLSKITEAELLIKLTNDLTAVIPMLNDVYRNSERVYPNRKTAEILLATVLMTQGKYGAAEPILKGIVNSSLYQWQGEVSKTFKKSGAHILWQLKPLFANESTNEVLMYYFEDALPFSYTLSNELAENFEAGDLRKRNWIKTLIIGGENYYRPDKYRNLGVNPDEYSIVFRLEEAYLLLAESLAQQNKLVEAIPYVNAVKAKAGISLLNVNASKELIINAILEENKMEFFTERGIRFLSLKRAGRLNELQLSKPNWKTHHRIWPLPVSELLLNSNLKPQNNGY